MQGWGGFIDSFAKCLEKSYDALSGDTPSTLISSLADCLEDAGVSVERRRARLYVRMRGSKLPWRSVVRRLVNLVIILESSKPRIVLVNLKSFCADIGLFARGEPLEKLVASYDPERREYGLADKGQLLVLSGLMERVYYPAVRGGYKGVCTSTWFACNELPCIRYVRVCGYPYGSVDGEWVNLETPRSRSIVVIEYPRVTLTAVVACVRVGSVKRPVVYRTGDLLYELARPAMMPYRLASIDRIVWREAVEKLPLGDVQSDIWSQTETLSRPSAWKLRSIEYRASRSIEQQLRQLLHPGRLVYVGELPAGERLYEAMEGLKRDTMLDVNLDTLEYSVAEDMLEERLARLAYEGVEETLVVRVRV